jgi:hypothetical protein
MRMSSLGHTHTQSVLKLGYSANENDSTDTGTISVAVYKTFPDTGKFRVIALITFKVSSRHSNHNRIHSYLSDTMENSRIY